MIHSCLLDSFENLWHNGLPVSASPPQPISSTSSPPHLAARTFTSNESSVSSHCGSLHSLFSVLDENGDGQLSLSEILSLLAKLRLGSSQSIDLQSPIIEHSASASTAPDDVFSLDFPQFALLYTSLFGASSHDDSTQNPAQDCSPDDCYDDDELLDAFHVYDTNRDGLIDAAELAAVLFELGLLPDGCGIDAHLGRCQAYIDSVDLDGDGMVDLYEFKLMMTGNHLSICG